MRQTTDDARDGVARTDPRDGATLQPSLRTEEVHLRNFDPDRTYDLTVRVRDDDGPVLDETYTLPPGATRSELGELPPGLYEVTVDLGGGGRETARCAVGESAEHTVLVELGNRTVSVTEGLYS